MTIHSFLQALHTLALLPVRREGGGTREGSVGSGTDTGQATSLRSTGTE